MRRVRLAKLLSANGITRSQSRALIAAGRVTLNGAPARSDDVTIDADECSVAVDGRTIRTDEHLHLMIHKPAGVITATSDPRDRTVMDLLPVALRRRDLGPVGRLDKDVTGLVLMTTDGQLAHRLISPRWEQPKKYLAEVEGELTESAVELFARGVPLKEFTAKPAKLTILSRGETSRCEVIVSEGKYHQVKRMLSCAGHPILSLHRAEVAGIPLPDDLAPGQFRELTSSEINHLYAVTNPRGGEE